MSVSGIAWRDALSKVASGAASAENDAESIGQVVTEAALALFGGTSATIWMPVRDSNPRVLALSALSGYMPSEIRDLRLPESGTSIGRVASKRQPLLLSDTARSDVPPKTAMLAKAFDIRSAMMLPYADVGTLALASTAPETYDADGLADSSLFAMFAGSVAMVTDRGRAVGRDELLAVLADRALPLLDAALGEIEAASHQGRRRDRQAHLDSAADGLRDIAGRIRALTASSEDARGSA